MKSSSLAQELQDALGQGVGLRQHGRAGLDKNLAFRVLGAFLGDIDVFDP
jgi:hypothetical protein